MRSLTLSALVLSLAALIVVGFVILPTHTKAINVIELQTKVQNGDSSIIPGKYIVVYKANPLKGEGASFSRSVSTDKARIENEYKAEKVFTRAVNGFSASLSENQVADLEKDPAVAYVVPDRMVTAGAITTTSGSAQIIPTGLRRINGVNLTNKGAGVNVAVIDTGIDSRHPDLAGRVVGGVDCMPHYDGEFSSYEDDNGHGTHVAGTIAANDNQIGVVGVAPEAQLWSVKVLGGNNFGTWSTVICGLDFVTANAPANGGPIKVANMSLGGGGQSDNNCGLTNSDPVHAAVCRARDAGVTIVVAAMNNGGVASGVIPASYDDAVITVSALGDTDGLPGGLGTLTSYRELDDMFAGFSNYGSAVDIGAPGVDILSTVLQNDYVSWSGTSMATPHVAGAAALYLASHPNAPWTEVREALIAQSEPPGPGLHQSNITAGIALHPEPVLRVTQSTAPSGTIQATGCTTSVAGGTCPVAVTWSARNSFLTGTIPFSVINVINNATRTFYGGSAIPGVSYQTNTTSENGTHSFYLRAGSYKLDLYGWANGAYVFLGSREVTVSDPTTTLTGTLSVTPCVIGSASSILTPRTDVCDSMISWTTQNAAYAYTTITGSSPYLKSIYPYGYTTPGGVGLSKTNVPFWTPTGTYTVSLYVGGKPPTKTAAGTGRKITEQVITVGPLTSPPTGSISAAGCTPSFAGGECGVAATWAAQNSFKNNAPFSVVNVIDTATNTFYQGSSVPGVSFYQGTSSTSFTFRLKKGNYQLQLYGWVSGAQTLLDQENVTVTDPPPIIDPGGPDGGASSASSTFSITSLSPTTPPQPAKQIPTGTLTLSPCTIGAARSTLTSRTDVCDSKITWSTTNANSAYTVITGSSPYLRNIYPYGYTTPGGVGLNKTNVPFWTPAGTYTVSLYADGTFPTKTVAGTGLLLDEQIITIAPAVPSSTATTSANAASAAMALTHSLAPGWTGPEVITLQQILINLGLLQSEVTGYFGSLTQEAVMKFQEARRIPPAGIVGPATRQALMRE